MRTRPITALILAIAFLAFAQPCAASYDVTGGDAVIGLPDDTSDGIRFLDPVNRTATVTADKTIGVITATPSMSVSTAQDDTGTLILQGSTTVNGDIGSESFALLSVDTGAAGTSSVFSGDVYAGIMNITGTGTATLNADLNGALSYDAAGIVNIGDGAKITGNVTNDTGSNGAGTLTFSSNGAVLGQIGALNAALNEFNAGVDGTTSIVFSDVYAQTTNITGTGTLLLNGDLNGDLSYDDDGAVTLAGNSTITGNVSNDTGLEEALGSLTLSGSGAVLGLVGDEDKVLKMVSAGANGSNSAFFSNIYAETMHISGSGNVVLDGELYGDLVYDDNGALILADEGMIHGIVLNDTGSDGKGILTLSGDGVLEGAVGQSGASLNEINAGADGSTTTFEAGVYVQTLNVTGTGSVVLQEDLEGNINYEDDGSVVLEDEKTITGDFTNGTGIDAQGSLVVQGDGTVTGQIGASGASLKAINVGDDGSASTFFGDIYVQTMNIVGTGDVVVNGGFDGILSYQGVGQFIMVGDHVMDGSVANDTGIDSRGVLTLLGGATVRGPVGALGMALEEINAGAAGTTSTFQDDVYVQTMNVTGTGNVRLDGDLNGDLDFNADGRVLLGDGVVVNGIIANNTGVSGRGTLTMASNGTVSGQLGTATYLLKAVEGGADGAAATFSGDIYAGALNVTGAGDVFLNADLHGALSYDADGRVVLGNNVSLTGAVTNDVGEDAKGVLTLSVNALVGVNIGAEDASLKEVNAGVNGTSSTFSGTVYTESMNVTGTGQVTLDGNLNGTLNYNADGIVNIAEDASVIGDIVNNSGSGSVGELHFLGSYTTAGVVGVSGGGSLRWVSMEGGTFTMAHDMAVDTVYVDSEATLALSGDRTITDGGLLAEGSGSAIDLGTNTLTFTNGGVDLPSGTQVNVTVAGPSVYGRIVQAAADAVVSSGTVININVAGYIADSTVLTIIDGAGGTGVPGGLTVIDNDMVVSFIVSAIAGPDLILTAFIDYDPANLGGSTRAVAEALRRIESQPMSADMQTIFDEVHGLGTAGALSSAVTQMRPYEGTAIVDQANVLSAGERRSVLGHLSMVRADAERAAAEAPNRKERQVMIAQALDEYEENTPIGRWMADDDPDELVHANIWVDWMGATSEHSAHSSVEGYSAMARGLVMGIDTLRMDNMVLGVALGYGMAEIDPDQFGIGQIDVTHYPLILYAELHGAEPWRLDGVLSMARNNYDTSRRIRFGGIDRTAAASFDGRQADLYVEAAYDLKAAMYKITPSASLNYTYIALNDYQETGADALNLNIKAQNYSFLRSGLGIAASAFWDLPEVRIIPRVYGRYQREWLKPSVKTTATFEGSSVASFETTAVTPASDTLEMGMSCDLALPKDMSIRFNYDAELSQDYSSNILSAQFKTRF